MKEKIKNLKENNLYRKLKESEIVDFITVQRDCKKLISFCCNDYLGLSYNSQVKKAGIKAIEKYGVGGRASRYITGNNSLYTKLEKEIAKFKKCDDAIVFSSGYLAAIGVIPALVGKGDLIIADKLIHSSLIDGSKLSGAKLHRFAHNDVLHAEKILKENRKKYKNCLIITETVFSMDGDLGKIDELQKLANKFDSLLMSDAAHDLWQKNNKKPQKNYIQLGTLSKSIGALGGYVAADKITINYLQNFAKSQIYSTALPPSVLASALESIKTINKKDLAEKSLGNAKYFAKLMGFKEVESSIIVIIIGDNKKVIKIASAAEKQGFLISAIRPPTVEKGKARLRLTFSALHKKKDIKKLAEILSKLI